MTIAALVAIGVIAIGISAWLAFREEREDPGPDWDDLNLTDPREFIRRPTNDPR